LANSGDEMQSSIKRYAGPVERTSWQANLRFFL
jgi:hypothetical protein